jgi:sugar phosphate isomerase/epimerase
MEIAFVAQPYNDEQFEEGMREIGAIGYSAVELKDRRVRTFGPDIIESIMNRSGLKIIQLNTYFDVVHGDKAVEKSFELNHEMIGVATRLKAPNIRVFTGPIGNKDTIASADATPLTWKAAAEALGQICDEGAAHGLSYFVETHHGTLADTTPSILKLLELVDSPNFWVNLQIPLFNEPDVCASTRELAPYVRHAHLNNFDAEGHNTFLGEGVLDIRKEIEILREAGFDGALSVEHAYHHQPVTEVARKEFSFLDGIVKDLR